VGNDIRDREYCTCERHIYVGNSAGNGYSAHEVDFHARFHICDHFTLRYGNGVKPMLSTIQ
jgi:hypothetical protein